MRTFKVCFLILSLFLFAGCAGVGTPEKPDAAGELGMFNACDIDVVGLSEVTQIDDYDNISKIKVYVDVFDSYGTKMKVPGYFRFELFEYQPRSADPKGRRIYLWRDYDVRKPEKNNLYWRDALRSYEFELTMDRALDRTKRYVVLVTCTTLAGQRLTDQYIIKYRSK